jgi:hypothetical protein
MAKRSTSLFTSTQIEPAVGTIALTAQSAAGQLLNLVYFSGAY